MLFLGFSTPLQTAKLPKQKLKKLFTFLSLPFCSNFWQRPTFFQSDEHSRPSSEHYSLLSSSEEDEELVPLRKHSVSFIKKIGPVMKIFAKSPQQTTNVGKASKQIFNKSQGPKKGLTDAAIMLCKLNKSP